MFLPFIKPFIKVFRASRPTYSIQPQPSITASLLLMPLLDATTLLIDTRSKDAHRNMSDEIKEVPWTDDAIRWQGGLDGDMPNNNKQTNNDTDDNSEDNGCMVDPFADPDPTELQTFRFSISSVPSDDDNTPSISGDSQAIPIDVTIRGYKTGADAVWKSTGLTLWKASHYLCQYQVEKASELFQNKRVLELGAGLGLNGILGWKIMCYLESASRVVTDDHHHFLESSMCITDGDSDALVHLRENIQRNQSTSCKTKSEVSCHQLLWGSSNSQTFLTQIAKNQKYGTILASDIIYAPSIIQPLWETIQTLLDREGVFVMAFARRKVPVSIELVLEEATKFGFDYELVKEDQEEGIWVYTFRFAE